MQQEAEGLSVIRFCGRPGQTCLGLLAGKICPNKRERHRAQAVNFTSRYMAKIRWKLIAPIGLMMFSQIASAAPDSRVTMAAGNSADRNGARFDLAQAADPAASATTTPAPLPDSKGPNSSPPAASAPPNPPSTTEVVRAAPSTPGCALKYMGAEVAGKLKGRKWNEFRQEECGASTTLAVFPSMIAPKYSGASPDKARTLTCADQFNANKATNANGGLKWIEMSGGYYSECVSRLKG
jgi:hypothetical protein